MQYRLKSISTERFNIQHEKLPKGQFDVNPIFKKRIVMIDENTYDVRLLFLLDSKEDKKTPFKIELLISGTFEFKEYDKDELISFLNINATQILFPYLRSTLSSAMAALMIPPIIIPLMDARSIKTDLEDDF